MVTISGKDLTIEDIDLVARHGASAKWSEDAPERMRQSRSVVEEHASRPDPIYGLNTGVGALREDRISVEAMPQFQRNLLMSHAVGVGDPLPTDVVRAMMLTRINGFANGGAGVQPAIADVLLGMLNKKITPIVPRGGSTGMSDLAQMAHLSLPLISVGEVDWDGRRMRSAEALVKAGLPTITLGPKDGLALLSANAASIGQGALVVSDAFRLLHTANCAAALSIEALPASMTPFDARLHDKPHRSQGECAQQLRDLLKGSSLWQNTSPHALQDPLSYRCVPQVHGAAQDALAFALHTIESELNSCGDNPMVLIADRAILSNGNFHSAAIATSFDALALVLAQVSGLATSRVLRLQTPAYSHLPHGLMEQPGVNTGLSILQKTITALHAEVRFLAQPMSIDFLPIADSMEDHATNAPSCVNKAALLIDKLQHVLAIELLCAAQAIDLRQKIASKSGSLGEGTRKVLAAVRDVVAFEPVDHVIAPNIQAIKRLISTGRLQEI